MSGDRDDVSNEYLLHSLARGEVSPEVAAATALAVEVRQLRAERTTPAPASGAGLDLDAMARRYSTATDDEVIYEMYPALEAEVGRLTAEAATQREWFEAADAAAERRLDQSIAWMERAEAAEADAVTLRAKVAAVEALVNNGQTVGWIERDGDVAWIAADAIRAALAVTTGEGE